MSRLEPRRHRDIRQMKTVVESLCCEVLLRSNPMLYPTYGTDPWIGDFAPLAQNLGTPSGNQFSALPERWPPFDFTMMTVVVYRDEWQKTLMGPFLIDRYLMSE